jgi:hypothetical protein
VVATPARQRAATPDTRPAPCIRTRARCRAQIPTKIEVFIALPGAEHTEGGVPAATKRLGYLSFDSNERSGHQARELKSVHVSIDAVALRLVVHRCHVNKLNIYNQVGGGGGGRWCSPTLATSGQPRSQGRLAAAGRCAAAALRACRWRGSHTDPGGAAGASPAGPRPCHTKAANEPPRQVGIVALNLIGEPLALAAAPPAYLEVGPPPGAAEGGYCNRWGPALGRAGRPCDCTPPRVARRGAGAV